MKGLAVQNQIVAVQAKCRDGTRCVELNQNTSALVLRAERPAISSSKFRTALSPDSCVSNSLAFALA